MSYTLVSATVLGFELAQLPLGPVVAQALLTGLTADTTSLLRLAPSTRRPRSEPVSVPQLRGLSAQLSPASTVEEVIAAVRASRWDGAVALDRLLRHEVLGPDCAALAVLAPATREHIADVLADTALSAWAVSLSEGGVADGGHAGPAAPDLASFPSRVRAVISPLVDRDPIVADGWRSTAPVDTDAWTQAMHQACWAAHLTGRVREAAAVQMVGVIAFRRAGLGPAEVRSGSWTALSGVLQAAVVADLLDQQSLATLLAPAPAAVSAPSTALIS